MEDMAGSDLETFVNGFFSKGSAAEASTDSAVFSDAVAGSASFGPLPYIAPTENDGPIIDLSIDAEVVEPVYETVQRPFELESTTHPDGTVSVIYKFNGKQYGADFKLRGAFGEVSVNEQLKLLVETWVEPEPVFVQQVVATEPVTMPEPAPIATGLPDSIPPWTPNSVDVAHLVDEYVESNSSSPIQPLVAGGPLFDALGSLSDALHLPAPTGRPVSYVGENVSFTSGDPKDLTQDVGDPLDVPNALTSATPPPFDSATYLAQQAAQAADEAETVLLEGSDLSSQQIADLVDGGAELVQRVQILDTPNIANDVISDAPVVTDSSVADAFEAARRNAEFLARLSPDAPVDEPPHGYQKVVLLSSDGDSVLADDVVLSDEYLALRAAYESDLPGLVDQDVISDAPVVTDSSVADAFEAARRNAEFLARLSPDAPVDEPPHSYGDGVQHDQDVDAVVQNDPSDAVLVPAAIPQHLLDRSVFSTEAKTTKPLFGGPKTVGTNAVVAPKPILLTRGQRWKIRLRLSDLATEYDIARARDADSVRRTLFNRSAPVEIVNAEQTAKDATPTPGSTLVFSKGAPAKTAPNDVLGKPAEPVTIDSRPAYRSNGTLRFTPRETTRTANISVQPSAPRTTITSFTPPDINVVKAALTSGGSIFSDIPLAVDESDNDVVSTTDSGEKGIKTLISDFTPPDISAVDSSLSDGFTIFNR